MLDPRYYDRAFKLEGEAQALTKFLRESKAHVLWVRSGSEITTFPFAKHDDEVDSTSQALEWIAQDAMTPKWSVQPLQL